MIQTGGMRPYDESFLRIINSFGISLSRVVCEQTYEHSPVDSRCRATPESGCSGSKQIASQVCSKRCFAAAEG